MNNRVATLNKWMAAPRSDFQPLLARAGIGAQVSRRAVKHDAAVAHHQRAVGDVHGNGQGGFPEEFYRAVPRATPAAMASATQRVR